MITFASRQTVCRNTKAHFLIDKSLALYEIRHWFQVVTLALVIPLKFLFQVVFKF